MTSLTLTTAPIGRTTINCLLVICNRSNDFNLPTKIAQNIYVIHVFDLGHQQQNPVEHKYLLVCFLVMLFVKLKETFRIFLLHVDLRVFSGVRLTVFASRVVCQFLLMA